MLEAKTVDELLAGWVGFTRQLGFNTVSGTVVIDRHGEDSQFITLHNTPAGYLSIFRDRNRAKRSPVAQHCKHSSRPIVWDQSTYLNAGRIDMWEQQARYGYSHGVSLALHLPQGRHFLLGMDVDQPLPRDEEELTRIVAAIQLLAVYAQEPAFRLLIPPQAESMPALTLREIDTLQLTMDGKTAAEVAASLGISERTVVLHANNATRKLGCANKQHAMLRATQLGLLKGAFPASSQDLLLPAGNLTPRELEVLRWTLDGKTAAEVAEVLHISERTAVMHAGSAARKLQCINKHQAALRALRLGLIG